MVETKKQDDSSKEKNYIGIVVITNEKIANWIVLTIKKITQEQLKRKYNTWIIETKKHKYSWNEKITQKQLEQKKNNTWIVRRKKITQG